MSLTERQKRFVRAYRETGNAPESYRHHPMTLKFVEYYE